MVNISKIKASECSTTEFFEGNDEKQGTFVKAIWQRLDCKKGNLEDAWQRKFGKKNGKLWHNGGQKKRKK